MKPEQFYTSGPMKIELGNWFAAHVHWLGKAQFVGVINAAPLMYEALENMEGLFLGNGEISASQGRIREAFEMMREALDEARKYPK